MLRKNTRHLPIPLTGHVDELPDVLRNRLRNSWAESFIKNASVGRTKSGSAYCMPMCLRGRMCRSNVETFKPAPTDREC